MKKIIFISIFVFAASALFAQFQIGQNMSPFQNVAPETQNQALSAWYGVPQLNFSTGSRIDGFGNRPVFQTLAMSAPTGNNTGAVLVVNREKAGLTTLISANFSFLYSLNLAPEKAMKLVFHGTGSFNQMSFNIDDAIVNHASDPLLTGGTTNQPTGNASAGLALLSQNKYYVGINASQLIPVRYGFMNSQWDNKAKPVIGFQAAYIFNLNEYASLQAWASASYSNSNISWQVGTDFKYRKIFWVGAGYRDNGSLLFNAGITAQSFSFGYSFAYGFSDAVSNNATYAGVSNAVFIRKVFNEQKSAR
jgi:type IX secretion system PorP/SprF family membrane protein